MNEHLNSTLLEQWLDHTLDADTRAQLEHHLTACATCRAHLQTSTRLESALRAQPRALPPHDLATLITTAVEWRVAQEQTRRTRVSFITGATMFSVLLLLWFGFTMIVALEDNNAVDFFFWILSHPEIIQTHFLESLLALWELLPISEILLTLFALFTVVVLAQQWVETVQSRAMFVSDHH